MIYLHDSDIVSHGNLRSSNCLVDSRWVLQISDFGLHEFKGNKTQITKFWPDRGGLLSLFLFLLLLFAAGQLEPDAARRELRRCLWRAPELLRAIGAACIGHHHGHQGHHHGHHGVPGPGRGTQKGDVYSFGILLYEIIGRAGPWGSTTLTDQGILPLPQARVTPSSLVGPRSTR